MIRRSILVFLTMITFSAAAHGYVREGWDNGLPEGVEEMQHVNIAPETIDEMTAAASLIVRGRVDAVEALDPEFETRGGSQRNYNMRRKMLAIITVEKVYKGGFDSTTLSVEFMSSEVLESPSLMTLEEGERAILFLVPGSNPPHFAPVNYYAGKASADYEPEEIEQEIYASLRPEDVKDEDSIPRDPGSVTVDIRAMTEQANPGAPVFVTVVIFNNTRGETRLDNTLNPVKTFTIVGPDGERITPAANYNPPEPNVTRLGPDHFTGAKYDITRYFDMTTPGLYKIRASIMKPAWSKTGSPELIVSNTVSVIIGE